MQHAQKRLNVHLAAGLAVVMFVALTGCSLGQSANDSPRDGKCGTQTLPQGWTWYQDARYPFRVAVPPGWRAGSFEYTPDGSNQPSTSPSYIHVVDLFGPGSVGQATSNGVMRSDTFPPVITIEVDVGAGTHPNAYGTGQLSNFHAQPTPVCIGKTAVTQYLFTNDQGDVEQAAVLQSGPKGYPYSFLVAFNSKTAPGDATLFQTVLATFSPTSGA